VRVFKDPQEMHAYAQKMKHRAKTIGLVPTMGYLHEGHLSLVEAAKKKADIVVVSIFVNPTQFRPEEDFSRYPRDLKRDKNLLGQFDINALFLPEASKLYPNGFKTYVEVESLSKKMCGHSRPTHFRGVATIITKLFNLVLPDFAFFGDKDYQQRLIIEQLTKDLNFPTRIISLPTVREFDGLAMSSRNQHLSDKDRANATILQRALLLGKEEIASGERNPHKILLRMRSLIGTIPAIRLDYVTIADPETLEEVKAVKGKVIIALAAQVGKARLIDNLVINAG